MNSNAVFPSGVPQLNGTRKAITHVASFALLATLILQILPNHLMGGEAGKTGSPETLATHRESGPTHDQRMQWWRGARFGMFIHWGLYAIPAGEWMGETRYAEWIRNEAKISLEDYDRFVGQFNPTNFDAEHWVQLARRAGMKYLVITSKHHDGFCLWDSKLTDFDVASTPFHRDVLEELSGACQKEGVRFCTYYSIMDWHHPDYLPRRDWEGESRPMDGANYDRYRQYLKGQLREIVANYHPAVL